LNSISINIGGLSFRSINVDGRASIVADIPVGHRRGIYIYRFYDGRWYAGKSEDVAIRYVQHRHEYRHTKSRPIVETMWFAEVPGKNAAKLDDAETAVIAALEAEGLDLVNVMKTKAPGGTCDVVTNEAPCFGLHLPWFRADRPRCGKPPSTDALAEYESASKCKRFTMLASVEYWPRLLPLLQRYVMETIPAPDVTAGTFWVATAFPTASGNSVPRTTCVSCGNVETLVMFEEDSTPYGFMNVRVDKSRGAVLPKGFPRSDVTSVDYGSARWISRIWFEGLDWFEDLLNKEGVLDCAYRLNIEMMRKGPTMYRRFCNPWLARALLRSE
jgi:predicted GIY-YIG superfamily endonuclease